MNSILVSFILIIVISTVTSLLGNFFDIPLTIYMPYIAWGVGLCILNLILEKTHTNRFMENIIK
tara:strand:- start:567 stop:758 length:192 start_codon:yes stop_codon:yes gene_type:complete